MKTLAFVGAFIALVVGVLLVVPTFGELSFRIAVASLIVSFYSAVGCFTQAHYAKRQAEVAESTNARGERNDSNAREPQFKVGIPTGNKDKIIIPFEVKGGLARITHAEVALAGTKFGIKVPRNQLSSPGSFHLEFVPPDGDKIFPFALLVQFDDFSEHPHELNLQFKGWGRAGVALAGDEFLA